MGRRSPAHVRKLHWHQQWPAHATAMAGEKATARNRRCASCPGNGQQAKHSWRSILAYCVSTGSHLRDRRSSIAVARSSSQQKPPATFRSVCVLLPNLPVQHQARAPSRSPWVDGCLKLSDPGAFNQLLRWLARRSGDARNFRIPLALIVVDTMSAAACFRR